jgi:hypothetical protein
VLFLHAQPPCTHYRSLKYALYVYPARILMHTVDTGSPPLIDALENTGVCNDAVPLFTQTRRLLKTCQQRSGWRKAALRATANAPLTLTKKKRIKPPCNSVHGVPRISHTKQTWIKMTSQPCKAQRAT